MCPILEELPQFRFPFWSVQVVRPSVPSHCDPGGTVGAVGAVGAVGVRVSESQSLRANVIMNEEALLGLKGVLTSRGLQGGSSRLSLDKRVPMFPQNKLEHFINNEKF